MAKKNNRTCIICKNEYHYCPNCGADAGKPTWYFIFDGQNCHDIYEVCTQYRDKEIDAAKAYELISKLDLSKIENFSESTQLQIAEIKRIHEESFKKFSEKEEKIEVKPEPQKNTNNTYKKK